VHQVDESLTPIWPHDQTHLHRYGHLKHTSTDMATLPQIWFRVKTLNPNPKPQIWSPDETRLVRYSNPTKQPCLELLPRVLDTLNSGLSVELPLHLQLAAVRKEVVRGEPVGGRV
jgi:hypothetical protein